MYLFSRMICLLLAVCSITGLRAQQINTAKLDSLFTALEQHDKIMGSVAVAKNGKLLYTRSIGYAQTVAGAGTRADAGTKYRIGSISKMFTATMIMQLVQEKKTSLDARLSVWFPEVPNADKITIEQMLRHHSGIFNITNDTSYTSWMEQPKTQKEMVALIAAHQPDFEPGTKAEYSNSNYILLGYIIEKITGTPYALQLKKRITDKAGLRNTYAGGKIDGAKNEAQSYDYNGDKWEQASETDMSIPGGAGAVVSTPSDLTRFITALFQGKLVNKASLQQMMAMKDNFGMGMFIIPWYSRQSYGHTGGIDGFSSALAYFPDDSVSVAITANGQNYNLNNVMIGILSIVYRMDYQVPDFKTVTLSPKMLSYYEGVYASKQLPLKITVAQKGGRLLAQATGQGVIPLETVSETEFKFDAAALTIIFKKGDDGNIRQFTLKQAGGSYLFEKE